MNNPNESNNQKSDAVKEYAKKKAKDQIRKMAEKKGLATALAPVLFWAAIIIVIIILLTGITAFILTAPGMVTGKLKEYSTDVAWEIASYFGADIKEKNASDTVNSYQEFASSNIENIRELLTIVGKHVYNKEVDGRIKLIIE